MARHRGPAPSTLSLLQALVNTVMDKTFKKRLQRSIDAEIDEAANLEEDMVYSHKTMLKKQADVLSNLNEIGKKLLSEDFLYIPVKDMFDVLNFRNEQGYGGGLSLLQALVKAKADKIHKRDLQISIAADNSRVERLEENMLSSHETTLGKQADFVKNFNEIVEKLLSEDFLYVSTVPDMFEVSNFKKEQGYGGGVKIEGNSSERQYVLKKIAVRYGLQVIE